MTVVHEDASSRNHRELYVSAGQNLFEYLLPMVCSRMGVVAFLHSKQGIHNLCRDPK